jgi:hypothetical protein
MKIPVPVGFQVLAEVVMEGAYLLEHYLEVR